MNTLLPILRVSLFAVIIVVIAGCSEESTTLERASAIEAPITEISDQSSWDMEWYHFADLECLITSQGGPVLIDTLLTLEDERLSEVLGSGEELYNFTKPVADAQVAGNKDWLEPLNADNAWRNNLPENLTFELRSRGDNVSPDEQYIFTHDAAYLLWPIKIRRHPRVERRWNERVRSLMDSNQLSRPEPIDFDSTKHTYGLALDLLDQMLESDRRPVMNTCYNENRNDRRSRRDCFQRAIKNSRRDNISFNSIFADNIDLRTDSMRFMVNTRLYASENGNLVVEIGTLPVDTTRSTRIPHWPCGRLIQP